MQAGPGRSSGFPVPCRKNGVSRWQFQGEDYITMFKRREIYRHLSNSAHRMAHCANTLHHLVAKIS